MKTLAQTIADKRFDWVNNDITEDRFPVVEVSKDTEYKLFSFDRYISSEDVIKEIETEGWRVANLSELLAYDWDSTDLVVALGSVAEVDGHRNVPYLNRSDSHRRLRLDWWCGGWDPVSRFLAVRNSQILEPKKTDLGNSESLTLRVEKLEKALKSVAEILSTHND